MVFSHFFSLDKYSEEYIKFFKRHYLRLFYFSLYFCKKIKMVLSKLFLAIGPGQIAVIAILVLLLFGGKKIPELMKGLGTGIKEFKKGVKEEDSLEEPKKKD